MNSAESTRRLPRWTTSFGWQILAALVLGVLLGSLAAAIGGDPEEDPNWLMTTLDTIGSSYVTILKAAVVPLVVTAVITSIANLRDVSNAARLAWKTLMWFAITSLIAVVIGMVLAVVAQPGVGTGQAQPEAYSGTEGSWLAFLKGLIPVNFLGLETTSKVLDPETVTTKVNFNVLQILVVSLVVGIAALKVGKEAEPFLRLMKSGLAIMQKVVWWIIRLAPLGTLGLIGTAVFEYGWTSMGSLVKFVLTVYAGLLLVAFVVYPVLLRLNGLSVKQFFAGVWPAMQLGFVSRSSLGTMPVTQRVSESNLGVPSHYASFVIPLGATTKMDGCAAVYPAVAAIFVAQFYGVDLTPMHFVLIAPVSVLGSAATAGTTGATVMLTLTLSTLGLPLDGVGLLLAVDPILDMGRTALNVTGQALVATIVSHREGILDRPRYDAPLSGRPFKDDDAATAPDASLPVPEPVGAGAAAGAEAGAHAATPVPETDGQRTE
ncbi:dicarboxylate/amino acid:cation symporter [Kocuria tytonicola]|uniref:Dicarboxylate/amino acid:cation symporter n=1 Tax=Kocuria tytonicola TaxID=2055946 RepID=A0A3L9L2H0_9MICC|nr:dicarboxylate/amino acid:cation symporter [Kocuria tytonicola]RLY92294.1 dicarboxylate/amino acid:cation symporter [Kocuria tytonicola]